MSSANLWDRYEAVIGLEVHCQLATDAKIFCACPARPPAGRSVADLASNVNTCPVCAGHPGALPTLNARAVEYAIRAGLATGCAIRDRSVLARKNYFYPDLPKGYQISQYDRPICEGGALEVLTDTGPRHVRILRIHLEEDAGKLVHEHGYSLVNLNRAGTPLVEIVSEPDLRSPAEAGAYLRALHAIVVALGISDGNMQEGNFRCDANVSIRPRGETTLGTRVEIKNVNSFRFVERAIEHEILRQIQVRESGGRIVQETRLYDADRNVTQSMRSKEEAQDYRYFPDPDLLPIRADAAWVERIRATLPELPAQKCARLIATYGLTELDAGMLAAEAGLTAFFEATAGLLQDPAWGKPAANWILGEVLRLAHEAGHEVRANAAGRITPAHVAEVVALAQRQTISSSGAKALFARLAAENGRPAEVARFVDELGLRQVSDLSALEPIVAEILAAHPAQAAELRAGKDKLLGFFVGQLMKRSGGKANPALLQDLIKKLNVD